MKLGLSVLGAVAGLALLVGLVVVNLAVGAPSGAPGEYEVREAAGFRYTVLFGQDKLRAHVVSADLFDPTTFPAYSAANVQRGRALIASGKGTVVPLMLTFKKPVPIEDARQLVAETGIKPTSWAIATQREDGGKGSGWFPRDIPADLTTTITGPSGQKSTVLGVMVISGAVPATDDGLGRLLTDPRVYIADITEAEIRRILAQDPKTARMQVEEVVVGSPFWALDW